jgi:hypothetical protein|tara:strand:- start:1666 stop:2202 length:537 start_codon:yes stop_codon:yes gene_type:complete
MRKTNSNIDKPIYQGKKVNEKLADRETYELLLDDYIDGIDVMRGESVTDYLRRKGFKGLLDDEVISKKIEKEKRIKLASESPEEEALMLMGIEARQAIDEYNRAKKKGYTGSLKNFLDKVNVDELDSRIRFFNSGGSVKPNGRAKDKPFTTAIEEKYKILLRGDETIGEVLEMIKNKR